MYINIKKNVLYMIVISEFWFKLQAIEIFKELKENITLQKSKTFQILLLEVQKNKHFEIEKINP